MNIHCELFVQKIALPIRFGVYGVYIMYYMLDRSDKFLYGQNVSGNYDEIGKHPR